jgi:hypothetical protein
VGYFTTAFEEELRDQSHMLEELRAGRYQAYEGLNVGEFRPYVEQALPAK